LTCFMISGEHTGAETAFAKEAFDFVSIANMVIVNNFVVTFIIVVAIVLAQMDVSLTFLS
jgi:hypothetical protein